MPRFAGMRDSDDKHTTKSRKQIGYLLSNKVSPLSMKQRRKLMHELHEGEVKVRR